MFMLTVLTGLQCEDIENILSQFCQGRYEVRVDGMDAVGGLMRKVMTFAFETFEDHECISGVFGVQEEYAPATGF